MSETRILIRLLRIYFPRISEFGPASEFFWRMGGLNPLNPPSVRHCVTQSLERSCTAVLYRQNPWKTVEYDILDYCMTLRLVQSYTGWSKSLCGPDDYSTESYKYCSKCLAADRQGQGGTRLTLTPSVIPNSNYVFMVSDWNCLKYFCVFLYYNHQVHRDFLITLYVTSNGWEDNNERWKGNDLELRDHDIYWHAVPEFDWRDWVKYEILWLNPVTGLAFLTPTCATQLQCKLGTR
jgi:hypothetical protein